METIQFSFAGSSVLVSRWLKPKSPGHYQVLLSRRILISISITWVPILILTATQGLAFGRKVHVPYILDLTQYARFFVALPIGLWAEVFISPRYESVLNRFIKAKVVSGKEIPKFIKIIDDAKSFKDSILAEGVILALVYLYMFFNLNRDLAPNLTTWYHPEIHLEANVLTSKSAAEHWYHWVSMPVFLFVWFKWIWRMFIWGMLLFRVSRLKLHLLATHPDHVGGLAFVSVGQRRLAVLVFAISAIVSASIGEEILFAGKSLSSFELELIVFFLACLLVVLGPLIVFTPPLIRVKLRDWSAYGVFAASYTQNFDEKWIQSRTLSTEALLGTTDISSLADLKVSYEGVSQMRTVLPDRQTIVILLAAYLFPIAPLLTTVIPLRQVLSELFKLLTH